MGDYLHHFEGELANHVLYYGIDYDEPYVSVSEQKTLKDCIIRGKIVETDEEITFYYYGSYSSSDKLSQSLFTNTREELTITSYDAAASSCTAGDLTFNYDFQFSDGKYKWSSVPSTNVTLTITETGQTAEEEGIIYPLITVTGSNGETYVLIGAPAGEDWDNYWGTYPDWEIEVQIPTVAIGVTVQTEIYGSQIKGYTTTEAPQSGDTMHIYAYGDSTYTLGGRSFSDFLNIETIDLTATVPGDVLDMYIDGGYAEKTFLVEEIEAIYDEQENPGNLQVYYNKPKTERARPLTFEVLSPGNIVWRAQGTWENWNYIEYNVNGSGWTGANINSGTGVVIPVVAGDVVEFRGNNETYGLNHDEKAAKFTDTTCRFNLKGNILSLFYKFDYATKDEFRPSSYGQCNSMFSGCTGLVDASELIFPKKLTAPSVFMNMFAGCTSLVSAPKKLVFDNAQRWSFYGMFMGCSSLVNGPSVVDIGAASGVAPCLGMFSACTSLTTAPSLPSTNISGTSGCYENMFGGCTAITTGPTELPATVLGNQAYNKMFYGCSSLIKAPVLPAAVVTQWCYSAMFSGCTNLNYIKCLATDISAQQCTANWVAGVAATGTFVKNPSMTSWATGNNGIPAGWTVEDA